MPSRLSRRQFAATSLAAAAAAATVSAAPGDKPNILWITCEDTGQQLGCYGDKFARTPVLDALAAKGVRYDNAWSNAPVCAPARTTIISGMYPPSIGGEHMRSMVSLPKQARMYPCYLRDAGYYCSNNSKTDYNLEETGKVWDDSSAKAHWRNRKSGQPFFAIFNNVGTHESQIRKSPHTLVNDPKEVRVPAYMPDTPEVRHDWTQYYDNIQAMDTHSGTLLKQLADAGLAGDTIVFFYGDHGAGMPRSKRWPYDSGLRVPLIAYFPDKYKHLAPKGYAPGKALSRMVGFVDLAPTLCSLVGVKPPAHLQGLAFAGPHTAPERPYNFGFRGRMDERIDCVRSCTDGRYVYLRQFMPHKIYGQQIGYMMEMPTAAVWKKMYDAGQLKPPQTFFWETKPSEELYDITTDRDEVKNLASSPQHQAQLLKMRKAVHDWQMEIRDVGMLPECDVLERAAKAGTPYDVGHADGFPMARILETAELASMRDAKDTPELVRRVKDADSGVRYWAALGLQMRGDAVVKANLPALRAMLKDIAAAPRLIAAEALGRFGTDADVKDALETALASASAGKSGAGTAILALNVITTMGAKAKPALDRIKALSPRDPNGPQRLNEYAPRLLEQLIATLS
ncbi:MAG: sulfatase-like hydrolase/transferase [Bryobacteraceae bacterium]|nr:sulfatase-like hydrolase/transferase [Bryobacteraceae bacterium]